jgi:mannose-6-phosphate isomerase
MYEMRNPIRRYAWGSTDAIPELLGVRPDGQPQAELWMGAYESEPSWVRIDRRWHDLAGVLRARGEPRLPFLAKVTAIAAPLSLQIHPETGPDPKTEMLYAWRPCRLLGGFREVATVRALLDDLRRSAPPGDLGAELMRWRDRADCQESLRECLALVLRPNSRALIGDVRTALRALPRWRSVAEVVDLLVAHHGADPAVLAPLLLADVDLAAGEAIVCRPGQPHTYLSGLGVEVQSNSDSVVRAGLTSKPVDVDAFVAGVVTDPGVRRVEARRCGPERVYAPDRTDVALGVVEDLPDGPTRLASEVDGPQILFCIDGRYRVTHGATDLELRHGESAFVPGSGGVGVVVGGKGCLFRVSRGRAGLPPYVDQIGS